MRTKTLLIAAAALAATVTASQAQTVYSQNVVGYINISITNGTSVMGANQLDTGSNTLNNVFQTGMISSKTLLQEWNGSGYNTYTYLNCADSPIGNSGWYAGSVEVGLTNLVAPGYGFFIHNSGASTITLPTVGQVVQGTNIYVVPPGAAIYSIPEALAGQPLDSTNINFPAISSKTVYQAYNGAGFNSYTYLNCADSPIGQSGWYSGSIDEDTNAAIWPSAGGSFFIHNSSSQTIYWTNVFEVQ